MRNIFAVIPMMFIVGCGAPNKSCQDVYAGIEKDLYDTSTDLGSLHDMNVKQTACNEYVAHKTGIRDVFNEVRYKAMLKCFGDIDNGAMEYSFPEQQISTVTENHRTREYSCLIKNFHTDVTLNGVKVDIPDATLSYSYQEFVDGSGYYRNINSFERNK